LTVITNSSTRLELEMKPNSLVKAPGLSLGAFGQLCSFQGPEEERSRGTPWTVSQNSAVLVRRRERRNNAHTRMRVDRMHDQVRSTFLGPPA